MIWCGDRYCVDGVIVQNDAEVIDGLGPPCFLRRIGPSAFIGITDINNLHIFISQCAEPVNVSATPLTSAANHTDAYAVVGVGCVDSLGRGQR